MMTINNNTEADIEIIKHHVQIMNSELGCCKTDISWLKKLVMVELVMLGSILVALLSHI